MLTRYKANAASTHAAIRLRLGSSFLRMAEYTAPATGRNAYTNVSLAVPTPWLIASKCADAPMNDARIMSTKNTATPELGAVIGSREMTRLITANKATPAE